MNQEDDDDAVRIERIRKGIKEKIDIYLKRNLEERRRTRRTSNIRKDPRGRKKQIDPVPEDVAFRNFLRDMFYPDGYFGETIFPSPWILSTKAVIMFKETS